MAVHIEGLRETTRAMEKAGVEVDDLKDVMGRVAQVAVDVMQPHIPARSGRLRGTARGNRAKGKATVTVGRASVPYAMPIQWGWPERHIEPAGYVEKTDAVMDDRAPELLAEGWQDIAERNHLI